jgi:hypothetical protein
VLAHNGSTGSLHRHRPPTLVYRTRKSVISTRLSVAAATGRGLTAGRWLSESATSVRPSAVFDVAVDLRVGRPQPYVTVIN